MHVCESVTPSVCLCSLQALDYAPHIRVLAVCPGATDTPLHRAGYSQGTDLRAVDCLSLRQCTPCQCGFLSLMGP